MIPRHLRLQQLILSLLLQLLLLVLLVLVSGLVLVHELLRGLRRMTTPLAFQPVYTERQQHSHTP